MAWTWIGASGRGFARCRSSRPIPYSVAALLLLACALKVYQLIWTPLPGTELLTSKWLLILIMEFELIFALFLLFGVFPHQTRKLTIALFSVFLAASLYQGVIGKSSCSCFGKLPINPWLTAMLDGLVIVGLFAWQPSDSRKTKFAFARRPVIQSGMAFAILLATVALIAGALPVKPAQINDDGLISGQGVILVEPSKWLGKRMPLLPYVNTTENLAAGTWTVVLIHSDCPKCQAVLPTYEEMARDWKERGLSSRVVVVVVPAGRPEGARDPIPLQNSFCTHGQLSDEREWFVQTPAVIKLEEGTVVEANTL